MTVNTICKELRLGTSFVQYCCYMETLIEYIPVPEFLVYNNEKVNKTHSQHSFQISEFQVYTQKGTKLT